METATTTKQEFQLNQIPLEFQEKFDIHIVGKYLRTKVSSIFIQSIKQVETMETYVMISAGDSAVFLYCDGEESIVIT